MRRPAPPGVRAFLPAPTGNYSMNRQTLINLAKLAVGVGLLVLLYLSLEDPQALWQQIAVGEQGAVGVGCALLCVGGGSERVEVGRAAAAAGIEVPLGRLLSYQWIAEFFNNFLPAQVGGDVMRGYELAADTHRAADAAASVLIDRFIGLFVFMSAAMVGSWALIYLWAAGRVAVFARSRRCCCVWWRWARRW